MFFNFSVLLFTKFPVDSAVEEEKQWRTIKTKINSKCRGKKFASVRDLNNSARSV